jgi:uncharacterized membrane protein YcaP (DUF421 family)
LVYAVTLWRLVSIMALTLAVTLTIMGKRPIGRLPVFDFLVIIVMGAVVGADVADPAVPHGPTAFAVIILGLLQLTVRKLVLRWRPLGRMLTFEPTVVIQDGQLRPEALRSIDYTIDEVLMFARGQGVFDLSEVEYAVVEPNGSLSVLKRIEHSPVTVGSLQVVAESSGLPREIILEGRVRPGELDRAGLTRQDLEDELRRQGYQSPGEVFYGSINARGEWYFSPMEPDEKYARLRH